MSQAGRQPPMATMCFLGAPAPPSWNWCPSRLPSTAAAIPLTVPAYGASIMINDQLTAVLEHTVIGTVQLLADHGYPQFAAVILIAGVAIPIFVLAALPQIEARLSRPSR